MNTIGSALSSRKFTETLIAHLQAGERVALCSVLGTRGSTPRPADARMALLESGEFLGTIGGGRLELLGQERCRTLLLSACDNKRQDAGESEFCWFTHYETGMMCGGDALIAVRMLSREDCSTLEAVLACGCTGGVLVEDWSNAEQPSWHVRADGEVGELPTAPTWDDERALYVEPLREEVHVNIYGAGHVSQALAPALASLGLIVNVFDERAELLTCERFPDAGRLQVCRFESLAEDELPAKHDYAVIMTPSHASDYAVLEQMVRCAPAYIGCIGSKAKTARFRSWLSEAGFEQARIDQVRMPVGVPIGAVTPAEIAVSIAAEIVRFRSTKR